MKPWEEEKIKNRVNPIVWAAGKLGRAKGASSVKVDLKPGAETPSKRQYPLQKDTLEGICPIIQKVRNMDFFGPATPHTIHPYCPLRNPTQLNIGLVKISGP